MVHKPCGTISFLNVPLAKFTHQCLKNCNKSIFWHDIFCCNGSFACLSYPEQLEDVIQTNPGQNPTGQNPTLTKPHRTKPHTDKTPSVIFSSGQNPTLQFFLNDNINDHHLYLIIYTHYIHITQVIFFVFCTYSYTYIQNNCI